MKGKTWGEILDLLIIATLALTVLGLRERVSDLRAKVREVEVDTSLRVAEIDARVDGIIYRLPDPENDR